MPSRLPQELQDLRHSDLTKVTLAFVILTIGLAAAVYQISSLVSENKKRIRENRLLVERQLEARERDIAQAKFQTYVLCRSGGRTVKQCDAIANGAVLPGNNIQLKKIEAALAKFGEATVTKLFVGPPGNRGSVGAGGKIGPAGPAGPKGNRGAKGDNGAPGPVGPAGPRGPSGKTGGKGQTGSRGATGPPGPQGAAGPAGAQGPPGPVVCPGLRIITIVIPSAGTFKIPVCP